MLWPLEPFPQSPSGRSLVRQRLSHSAPRTPAPTTGLAGELWEDEIRLALFQALLPQEAQETTRPKRKCTTA